jgi:hypothetical protein
MLLLASFLACSISGASAQDKPKEEKRPPTFWEEIKLSAYVENSYVFNLTGSGRDATNELRVFDFDEGWTFNNAQFNVGKDPSEKYPLGFGLQIMAGLDAQKVHALGIFRDRDDASPFRNTAKYDLQEAFLTYQIPIGSGLTLKAGKFVTLLGYEVIESPDNLNSSRSYMFGFSIPFTHVGALGTYQFFDWFGMTFGTVNGWDNVDENNGARSFIGTFAFTPFKDISANVNWVVGPEQNGNNRDYRWVVDHVFNYTGIKNLTLGLNVDIAGEENEASLAASRTRQDTDASWWGWAVYVAYDWTEKFRSVLRLEHFQDSEGVRTLAIAPGSKVSLYGVTATAQYKIWKGMVGRLEYRHDSADEKAFKIRTPGLTATSKSLDTISVSLYYSF